MACGSVKLKSELAPIWKCVKFHITRDTFHPLFTSEQNKDTERAYVLTCFSLMQSHICSCFWSRFEMFHRDMALNQAHRASFSPCSPSVRASGTFSWRVSVSSGTLTRSCMKSCAVLFEAQYLLLWRWSGTTAVNTATWMGQVGIFTCTYITLTPCSGWGLNLIRLFIRLGSFC